MNYFSEIIIQRSHGKFNIDGEYESDFRVDLILKNIIKFNIYETEYLIDRITISTTWYTDDLFFEYADGDFGYSNISINTKIFRALIRKILREQRKGILKGWSIEEELFEYYEKLKNNTIL